MGRKDTVQYRMNPPRRESSCCSHGRNSQQASNSLLLGSHSDQPAADERRLVQELNELSVQEREQVYNEIHGVATYREETPELIKCSCEELKKEVKRVALLKRRAYDRAVFLKPSLEDDVKFQLMFLRAERYDAFSAAKRLCLHFESKNELFGENKLVKDITVDDLDKEDIESGQSTGIIARLPGKDQSGRTVLFQDARSLRYKEWQNLTRFVWYFLMNECTDEETQKTGVVNVTYAGMSETLQNAVQMTMKGTPMLMHSLPIRYVALHFCHDQGGVFSLMALFQRVIGTQNRIRFRVHHGSVVESQCKLMSFGIHLPDYLVWSTKQDQHDLMIKYFFTRKEIEKQQSARERESVLPPGLCALRPGPKDVLLGRGRPYHSFPGNKAMVTMMNEYSSRYFSSSVRLDKTFIAIEIHQRITAQGGRFLERVERQGWKMVNSERGQQKVLKALCNHFASGEQNHRAARLAPPLEREDCSSPMKKRLRRDRSNSGGDERGGEGKRSRKDGS